MLQGISCLTEGAGGELCTRLQCLLIQVLSCCWVSQNPQILRPSENAKTTETLVALPVLWANRREGITKGVQQRKGKNSESVQAF